MKRFILVDSQDMVILFVMNIDHGMHRLDSPDMVVLFVMNIDHGMHRCTTADEDETRADRP